MLGYEVADAVDTGYHLTYVWADFIEEKISIEQVIGQVPKHYSKLSNRVENCGNTGRSTRNPV